MFPSESTVCVCVCVPSVVPGPLAWGQSVFGRCSSELHLAQPSPLPDLHIIHTVTVLAGGERHFLVHNNRVILALCVRPCGPRLATLTHAQHELDSFLSLWGKYFAVSDIWYDIAQRQNNKPHDCRFRHKSQECCTLTTRRWGEDKVEGV